MIKRKRFAWKVQLADESGSNVQTVDFVSYWSPEKEGTAEEVGNAAAAMASAATRSRWMPVAVQAVV